MALTVNHPLLREVRVYCTHIDTGSALSAAVTSPIRGKIVKLESVVHAAIGTANNAITVAINGTSITGGTLTQLTASSAIGDVVTAVPTALNFVAEGDVISYASDGAGTNVTPTTFIATIQTA